MDTIKRVFCVEDDKDIVTIMRRLLEKLGYQMCGDADNTRDAVAAIEMSNPDVVLVDITLNGELDGLDIGNYLVSKTDIPFIYLTGHADPEILKKAEKTIPNGFLRKPFNHQQLKDALDIALNVKPTGVLVDEYAYKKSEV